MSTAHLQPLTFDWWRRLTGWMIVIIRVYRDGDSYQLRSPYKFITVGVIRRADIFIYGMNNSFIELRDFRAMDNVLSMMGIKIAHWTHNGKNHVYKIRG